MMDAPVFLSAEQILAIHQRVIDVFGGDPGVRDQGLLESATAMPRAVFAGEFLHKSMADMAAAYHFHICRNHPFMDGNKRTAVAAAEVFLHVNGYELTADDDTLIAITLKVADGTASKQQLTDLFRRCTNPREADLPDRQ